MGFPGQAGDHRPGRGPAEGVPGERGTVRPRHGMGESGLARRIRGRRRIPLYRPAQRGLRNRGGHPVLPDQRPGPETQRRGPGGIPETHVLSPVPTERPGRRGHGHQKGIECQHGGRHGGCERDPERTDFRSALARPVLLHLFRAIRLDHEIAQGARHRRHVGRPVRPGRAVFLPAKVPYDLHHRRIHTRFHPGDVHGHVFREFKLWHPVAESHFAHGTDARYRHAGG